MLRWPAVLLALLLWAGGLGLRLVDMRDAPLDFHPVRQLHSALIARGMYLRDATALPEWQRSLPEWQRAMAVQQWHSEGQIEPPIMETLTVWGYRLAGGEALWIARLLAVVFWMTASVFVFLVALRMIGWAGALLALAFFLFWPYGVTASRSFQPEALMMAAMAATLWAGMKWAELAEPPLPAAEGAHRARRRVLAWAALTGVLAGLTIYVKLVTVFFVAPVLLVLVLRHGWRTVLRQTSTWLIGLLALLPSVLYTLDGLYGSGFLREQFTQRFYPRMWIDPAFYLRWIGEMSRALPFVLALVALLALLLLRRPLHRALLLALWVGYGLYGLALPHHIGTHDYYHLPLLLPAALGLGALAQLLVDHLRGPLRLTRLMAVGALLAAVLMTAYGVRNTLRRIDYRPEAARWQQIGVQLGPQAAVVALVDDYGCRLKYYGWIMPAIWPTADDLRWQAENGDNTDQSTLFERLADGKDYFVVSPLAELSRQPALAEGLAHYAVIYQAEDVLVYDLHSPIPSP